MNRSTSLLRRVAAALLAGPLAVGAGVALGVAITPAAPAAASTVPPWEPDPNSVGGLLLFNASGQQITGGNVTDAPLATYVEGTKTIRAGDTKATLFGFLPKSGQSPGQFSGEQMSGSTVYPNTSAPAPINSSSLPVVTGASGDESLSTLEQDFPNTDTSTDGYAGMYVLRLYTSQPGQPANTTYDSADIMISGSTWSVVYTKKIATHTALTVSPSTSAQYGTTVKLTATVSPSALAGSITFRDGTTVLGTKPVSSGSATLSTSSLPVGTDVLKAAFTPTNTSYATSSASHSLTVTKRSTKTSLTASKTTAVVGTTITFTAKVSPAVAGSVAFYNGTTKVTTVAVSSGIAKWSTSKLTVGKHSISAAFAPKNTTDYKSSKSAAVTVTVTK